MGIVEIAMSHVRSCLVFTLKIGRQFRTKRLGVRVIAQSARPGCLKFQQANRRALLLVGTRICLKSHILQSFPVLGLSYFLPLAARYDPKSSRIGSDWPV